MSGKSNFDFISTQYDLSNNSIQKALETDLSLKNWLTNLCRG